MKYRIAMALAITTTAAAAPATAKPTEMSSTPYSCDGKPMQFHVHRARVVLQRAYDLKHWRHRPHGDDLLGYHKHKFCVLLESAKADLAALRDKLAERFAEYARDQRQSAKSWCSPTPIASGAGCWEIPVSCVMSESGGSWSAANPSGAVGPYQLLGHGAPYPVTSRAQAMEHHRIAASLYASQGLAPWVAPGC